MAFSDLGILIGNVTLNKIERTTKKPMQAQEKLLKKIIRKNKSCELGKKFNFADIHSMEEFREKVPLTTYADYDPLVDRMILNKEKNIMFKGYNVRYCSSSGSVGKPKILPKSIFDIWNMQCIGFSCTTSVTSRHLKAQGKKLPAQMGPIVLILTGHKLEDGKMCNGAGQVPLTYLKPITKFFCTSPLSLLYPEHEELLDTSYLQLRFALQEEKVSFIGSVVITLVTTMFDYLEENWEMICDDIEHGTINQSVKITPEHRAEYEKKLNPNPKRAEFLRNEFRKGFDTPIAPRIWPRLTYAYGMVGSNLKVYVEKLRRSIGEDIPIHNMGYAAAEGFFAMPTELNVHDSVLIPYGIFFEFIPINDDAEDESDAEQPKTLLLNEVEVGKKYELVVTNSSGLYRYRLEDIVEVTRMYNNTPVIEFLYRKNLSMNVANEKTTTAMVDFAAKNTFEKTGTEFVGYSFYPDFSTNPPRYCMMTEIKGDVSEEKRQEMIDVLHEEFKEVNEKYFKYIRWGMLGRPEILILKPNTYWDYRENLRAQGVVLNQIKPVTVINSKPREEFFFSHVMTEESSTIDYYNEHKDD